MFAYILLAQEKERVGKLAEECGNLLRLTQEFMAAAALVHALGGRESTEIPEEAAAEKRSRFLGAYTKAGMAWAEVIGSSVAIADVLINKGQWDDVHRLIAFLDSLGENSAVEDLRKRAASAARRANEKQLSRIHAEMVEDEIMLAIEALKGAENEAVVSFYLHDLAMAIYGIIPKLQYENVSCDFGQAEYVVRWLIKAGGQVAKGDPVLQYTPNWGSYRTPQNWPAPFPALIARLKVADGATVSGSTNLLSAVKIPGPVVSEMRRATRSDKRAFERLDLLAREFKRIQSQIE